MTKTRKWRGLLSNVDLTNQKSFVLLFPNKKKKMKEKRLRADVSKYRPKVYKSEKSKILQKIHKVALGKLLT